MSNSDRKDRKGLFGDVGPYLTIGMQLGLGVVAFFLIGRWVDSQFSVAPWGMIIGLVVGMVGGFVKFFRDAIKLGKETDAASHKDIRSED